MKLIVTHLSPDLDAITSVWLIKKYLPGWSEAETKYVPAGSTYENKKPEEQEDIIHVDTGFGRFDHHQDNKHTSASKKVFQFLKEKTLIFETDVPALEEIVTFVTEIDNFQQVYYLENQSSRYDFYLFQIIEGLRPIIKNNDQLLSFVSQLLEAELNVIKKKMRAESEIGLGYIFQSKWGKSLALETKIGETINIAFRRGFTLVIQKNPDTGNIRIKTMPDRKKYDLSSLAQAILKRDKQGTWFFHAGKTMLLNGSSNNPNFVPSQLSLKEIIEIVTKI